jgi:hypothetical protein
MYSFWWYKPFDVEHVTTLQCLASDLEGLNSRFQGSSWSRRPQATKDDILAFTILGEAGEGWNLDVFTNEAFYITATVFSAIHLAAVCIISEYFVPIPDTFVHLNIEFYLRIMFSSIF